VPILQSTMRSDGRCTKNVTLANLPHLNYAQIPYFSISLYIYIYIYISGSQALTALSLPQILLQYFDIQRIVHRDVYTYNKTNEIHEVLKFISGIELYMFRTVLLSIIRNLVLYTQQ